MGTNPANPLQHAIEQLQKVERLIPREFLGWHGSGNGVGMGLLGKEFWQEMQDLMKNAASLSGPQMAGAGTAQSYPGGGQVGPPVDLFLTDTHLVVSIALPGLERSEDIKLTLVGEGKLRIEGQIPPHRLSGPPNTVAQMERLYGPFRRVIELPVMVYREGVRNRYAAGVLEVAFIRSDRDREETVPVDLQAH